MRELIIATIIVMTSIAIVIMGFAVFSEPLFQVNEALRDAANESGNPNLISDMDSITEKTEGAWFLWPVVYVVCLIGVYILWSQIKIHEKY